MLDVKSLIPEKYRNGAVKAAIAVVVGVALFCGGRCTRQPPEVQKIVATDELQQEVHREATSSKALEVARSTIASLQEEVRQLNERLSQKKDIVRTRRIVRAPDGTVTDETRVEDKTATTIDRSESSKTSAAVAATAESSKSAETAKSAEASKTVEKQTLTITVPAPLPKWGLVVGASLSAPALLGRDVPSYLGVPKALGVEAGLSYRVSRSLSIDATGSTRAELHLRLRYER